MTLAKIILDCVLKEVLYNREAITLRFKRVIFCFICSPFLLNRTIKEHLQKYLLLPDYRKVVLQLLEEKFKKNVQLMQIYTFANGQRMTVQSNLLLMIKKINPRERQVVTYDIMMKHAYKIHSVVIQNIVKYLALIGTSIQIVLFSNLKTLLKQQTNCKLPSVIFSRYLQCFSIHWVLCVPQC